MGRCSPDTPHCVQCCRHRCTHTHTHTHTHTSTHTHTHTTPHTHIHTAGGWGHTHTRTPGGQLSVSPVTTPMTAVRPKCCRTASSEGGCMPRGRPLGAAASRRHACMRSSKSCQFDTRGVVPCTHPTALIHTRTRARGHPESPWPAPSPHTRPCARVLRALARHHTHTRTHARTHARTRARAHAHTHTHTHTHTRTHAVAPCCGGVTHHERSLRPHQATHTAAHAVHQTSRAHPVGVAQRDHTTASACQAAGARSALRHAAAAAAHAQQRRAMHAQAGRYR
jgi:hypothetical protein